MRRWPWVFWAAALFNLAIGLGLLLAPDLAPGAPAGLTGAALLPSRLLGWCVLVFGLGYVLVARAPERNRDIARLSVVGKAGVVAIVAVAALAGSVPAVSLVGAGGDLVFTALFIAFLMRRPA